MSSINSVHLEVPDPTVVEAFYRDAFGLGDLVHLRLRPRRRSRRASVGSRCRWWCPSRPPSTLTIWKIATESKKDTGPATRQIDGIVLLLGVADMGESKRFYVDRGPPWPRAMAASTQSSKPHPVPSNWDCIGAGLSPRTPMSPPTAADRIGS
jgi:hypothetical protein